MKAFQPNVQYPMKSLPSTRLLLVEDDPDLAMGLADFFEAEGYEVKRVSTGDEALSQLLDLPPYDLAILDVMLPGKDGFEVLREARKMGVNTPVIMLTAKGDERDRLHGFSVGADDYVVKPFSAEELLARMRAVLRRSKAPAGAPMEVYRIGEVEINFTNHTAYKNGEEIHFTALEFDIMEYLIQHRGRTVSRKQLLRDVWGIPGDVVTRTIDRHVASLRKKIEPDPDRPIYIETVYGIGYKFMG